MDEFDKRYFQQLFSCVAQDPLECGVDHAEERIGAGDAAQIERQLKKPAQIEFVRILCGL